MWRLEQAAIVFCRYRPCVSYLPAYVFARRLGCEACFHCSLEPWHVSSVGTFLEFVSAGTAASWFRAHFGWRLGFWAEVGRCVFAPGFERLRTSLPPRALGRVAGLGWSRGVGVGAPFVVVFCIGQNENTVLGIIWRRLFCTRYRRKTQWRSTCLAKVVGIGEMLLFFGNDKTCCATGPQSQKPKKRYRGWSQSIREGIDPKLQTMAFPYKNKG